jgi:glycosyltransferase involved in cell wall biosynthesis
MTSAKKNPKLSVVFSFRNEEEVLPELIRRTRKVLNDEKDRGVISDYELIFVNDASRDSSLEVLLKEAQGQKDIKIINMSRRFGVTPCVMAGLEFSSGDGAVYMDCDLQDPPELIPKMLDAWINGDNVDVVHTVRLTRTGETKIKLFMTKMGYMILSRFAYVKLPMQEGDFKLLSRKAIDHLIKLREFNPFMRGLVRWIGFNQVQVPYHRQARHAGRTKFRIFSKDVIKNFIGSAIVSFSSAPLLMASYFGFLALFIDFILILYTLTCKILGIALPGWTALMIIILFFSGVNLLCIGIIGLYLNSMFEQIKGRPNYIIDNTYGFE